MVEWRARLPTADDLGAAESGAAEDLVDDQEVGLPEAGYQQDEAQG